MSGPIIREGNTWKDDNISVTRSKDAQKFVLNIRAGAVPLERDEAEAIAAVMPRAVNDQVL